MSDEMSDTSDPDEMSDTFAEDTFAEPSASAYPCVPAALPVHDGCAPGIGSSVTMRATHARVPPRGLARGTRTGALWRGSRATV
ncbi:hypothetical protein DAT35_48015 [Vitiosangium sp. GDMCC 1.1324]|nr:hypothetical protein DAT35_48015 [Vitiosangium sp. GDMCC 1.1324]